MMQIFLVLVPENCIPVSLVHSEQYDIDSGSVFHVIGKGSIILQLNQPYLIDDMRFWLFDEDDRRYKYFIEVSTDGVLLLIKGKNYGSKWFLSQYV